MFAISTAQLRLEVSGTERLLQAATDRQAVLFRAPYGSDLDPSVMEDYEAVGDRHGHGIHLGRLEYRPRGLEATAAEEIVRRVIKDVQKNEGHIVLLHDAGGDRSQTVKALPVLIDRLRALGYELVSVSNLMGRSRDDVMPPVVGRQKGDGCDQPPGVSPDERALSKVLSLLFLAGTALGIARLVFIAAARRHRQTSGGEKQQLHRDFCRTWR